jgi:hypothetical protein
MESSLARRAGEIIAKAVRAAEGVVSASTKRRNRHDTFALRRQIREIVMPRELVEPHKGDKRYVRRGKKGQFTSRQTNVGRSLSGDRRSKAKTIVKKGEGDRGDQRSD